MANQGLDSELINATEVTLGDGTDTYIKIQEINVNLSHPEIRETSTDNSVHYFYGPGDHTIEFLGLATRPEINTFVGLTELDSNGAPNTENGWVITYTDVSGSSATVTLTGYLNEFNIEKLSEGAVKIRGRIRVTEAVTAADDVA